MTIFPSPRYNKENKCGGADISMFKKSDTSRYADMYDLPHHQSETRPHMSLKDRAAQFSPFAALTGYDEAVKEVERMTECRRILSEDEKVRLDRKLQIAVQTIGTGAIFEFTYFVPDERKSGGAYIQYEGRVKCCNSVEQTLILDDGTTIEIDDIVEIDSELFNNMD